MAKVRSKVQSRVRSKAARAGHATKRAPQRGNGSPKRKPSAAADDTSSQSRALVKAASGLRVRMYRVGFGDFFLLSVPSKLGASHILIDCGVHARDLGSIRDAVTEIWPRTATIISRSSS